VGNETIGFLVGVLPGVAIVVRNMWHVRTLQKQIESVAWKERCWNDTQLGFKQQFNLLFHPERYIDPNDSPSLVGAKQALLSAWPQVVRHHWIGAGVVLAGGIMGIVLGVVLA
jgi:hypothetical protein